MKKLFTYFLMMASIPVMGQVFSESFEAWPPENWTIVKNEASSVTWTRQMQGAEGNYCAMHNYGPGGTLLDSWLIMPKISNLGDNIQLSFFEKNQYMGFYGTEAYSGVLISTGSGTPADGDFVELYESDLFIPIFQKKRISLSSYAGEDIFIAFQYKGDDAHQWFIDAVELNEVFPNDAEVLIDIESVFQVSDRIVFEIKVTNNGSSDLPSNTPVEVFLNESSDITLYTSQVLQSGETETFNYEKVIAPGIVSVKLLTAADDNLTNNQVDTSVVIFPENSVLLDFEGSNNLDIALAGGFIEFGSKLEGSYSIGKSYFALKGSVTSPKVYIPNDYIFGFYALGNNEEEKVVVYIENETEDGWVRVGDTIELSFGKQYYLLDFDGIADVHTRIKFEFMSDFYSNYPYVDYLVLPEYSAILPAPVASLTQPLTGVEISPKDMKIVWKPDNSEGYIEGYKLYIGTDGNGVNRPTNIENGKTTVNTSYNFEKLDFSTDYYIQIVPYNSIGDAENCPIWKITTKDEQFIHPPYSQSFEQSYYLPDDWFEYSGVLTDDTQLSFDDNALWDVSDYVNNPDSSSALSINIFSYMNDWILLPRLVLGDTIHHDILEFDLGVTSWSSKLPDTLALDDTLAVVVSEEGNWSVQNILYMLQAGDQVGLGRHIEVDLNAYSDTITLGFYASSNAAYFNKDIDVFIDNIRISRVPEVDSIDILYIDGVEYESFDYEVEEYTIELPTGTTLIPQISVLPVDPLSKVEITQAGSIPGEALVKVTAQNPNFVSQYKVKFDFATSDNNLTIQESGLYPNPVIDKLYMDEVYELIKVYDLNGKLITEFQNSDIIDLSELKQGVYYIQLINNGYKSIEKIIKK